MTQRKRRQEQVRDLARRRKAAPKSAKPKSPPKPAGPAAVAAQYCRDVIAERIVACKWVRLACQRHLRDLKDGKTRGLRFSTEHAQHVVNFFHRNIRMLDGPTFGQRIVLEPWEIWILALLFGWRNADGTRRFRIGYLEVARKNGKSTLLAGIGLYMTAADGEMGARCFSAATTFEQAKEVWDPAKRMVEINPVLTPMFEPYVAALIHHASGSSFRPLHAKQSSNEGKNIHFAAVDELHAHPDNTMWTVLKFGTGARRNALILAITTAGADLSGVCYEQREYVCNILTGIVEADHYFGVIYTIDDEDHWEDPKVWIKANPNLGVSVIPAVLENDFKDALGVPSDQVEFKRKRLNIWAGAEGGLYDLEKWGRLAAKEFDARTLAHLPVFGGIDAARKRDLFAVEWLFIEALVGTRTILVPQEHSDEPMEVEIPLRKYHLMSWLYLPEAALHDKENKNRWLYEGWHERGMLRVTPGNGVDFWRIRDDIEAFRKLQEDARSPIQQIGFDPHEMSQMSGDLGQAGIPMLEFSQTAKTMDAPMQELDVLIRDGMIAHDGNEVFSWMLGNVVGHKPRGPTGKYLLPGKKNGKEHNKIDGPVAAMMALQCALSGNTAMTMPAGWELASVEL